MDFLVPAGCTTVGLLFAPNNGTTYFDSVQCWQKMHTYIYNNIFLVPPGGSTQSGISYSDYFTELYSEGNCFFGDMAVRKNTTLVNGSGTFYSLAAWQAHSGMDQSSLNDDPLLLSSTDFRLQSGSPCTRAGVAINSYQTFYGADGKAFRKGNPSIGAYEQTFK
jgi:hypothetical protein